MAPGCLDPWPCGLLLWHASHAFRLRSCLFPPHSFLIAQDTMRCEALSIIPAFFASLLSSVMQSFKQRCNHFNPPVILPLSFGQPHPREPSSSAKSAPPLISCVPTACRNRSPALLTKSHSGQ
ncbi:hypothetical protein TsFJ059_008221 [Trichoderma semiorbis]|uniref:Uncharacterized protein n=1 Tax=Trichoderma semiorbis TaxID=1491008 RepID=A0A9P8KKU9_9HYPO|nr:hypothetical protein TsFJ059_008221 [Trichoderma semiorbis]